MIGDYNVNLLNIDDHLLTSEFFEIFHSYLFLHAIYKRTRVNCDSATSFITFIIIISETMIYFVGILYSDITDQFPII